MGDVHLADAILHLLGARGAARNLADATQYISHPEYPWHKLRKENPGVYESYADMVPGEWIKMKIVVLGKTAKLYLHESEQPCLIVNDLKKGESKGLLALWLHSSTVARYRNLVVISK